MTENTTEKYTTYDVYSWAVAAINKEGYGPDFVYRHSSEIRCAYVRNGECSCLVGHMLYDNDVVSIDDLAGYNYDGVFSLLDETNLTYKFTYNAIEFMHNLQMEQDHLGTSWGAALQESMNYSDYTPPKN